MARQVGPDQAERVFYVTQGAKKGTIVPAGTPVPLYADNQCSLPADVRALDGSTIAGTIPTVLIGDTLEVPQFLFPDVPDPVVYTRILGGPVVALHPSTDSRIDDLRERLVSLEPGGDAAAAVAAELADVATSAGEALSAAEAALEAAENAAADAAVVHNSGNEDVDGVKTFARPPVVPGLATKAVQVIFDGDSITAGGSASFGRNYPAQTIEGLDGRTSSSNFGVAGQTVVQMLSDVTTQVDPLYSPTKVNVVLVGGGSNDLVVAGGTVTVDTLYGNYVAYHQARRAAGFKTIALTLLPRTEGGVPANFEDKRQDFNTRVRTNWATFADGLADVGGDAVLGAAGASDNTTYYTDKTHPTNLGYSIMARHARAALASLGVVGAHDHVQYQPVQLRLWLPADRFAVQQGTPVLDGAIFRMPAYLMDAATDEIVCATINNVRDWETFSIDVYWGNAGAGGGDVRWAVYYNNTLAADGGTTGNTSSSFQVQTAGASAVLKVASNVLPSVPKPTGQLTALRVMRAGTTAADTLPNDAAFLGLMLNKVS